MTRTVRPERSDAIRAGLIAQVAAHPPRRRMGWAAAGLVAVGAVAGAGASAAAFAVTDGWPGSAGGQVIERPVGGATPALGDAVAAPPGVVPGQPIITVVADPTSVTVNAPVEIPLADRPSETTHLRVTVTCLTPGTLWWGTDAGGNNPGSSCAASDVGSASGTAWMDLPLDASTATLYVTPESAGAQATVTLQYLNYVPTLFGVNARGETYGTSGSDRGEPDLLLVEGIGADGARIEGYVRSTDLYLPDDMPTSPEEAARRTPDPNGRDIPVYESDGVTQIGTFHIGG